MKRYILTALAALMMLPAIAQISVWSHQEYQSTVWEQNETGEWYDTGRDTTYTNIFRLNRFNYDQVDSITFAVGQSIQHIYFWADGRNVTSYLLPQIDSLVWQPYIAQDFYIGYGDTLTLPIRDSQHSLNEDFSYGIRLMPDPGHADVNREEVSLEDNSIADVSISSEIITNGSYYQVLLLNIAPKAVGKTSMTITLDNVTKHFILVITPQTDITDSDLPLDELYAKIYSRMIETGDQKPDGKADISGLDEGTQSFYRVMHQINEVSADQLYWVWADMGIDQIRSNSWDANNFMLSALFERIYYNIYLCNSYLDRADAVTYATERGEVRFIRAYFYYQLMDLFGNVPIVTRNADFRQESQASREQVYEFVVSELQAAEAELPAHRASLYRVDKVAAQLLLSRVYLNCRVYAGKDDYYLAAQYAAKAIDSQYQLATDYANLFRADNDVNGAENEIVWSLRQVGSEHSSWSGSKYLVAAFASQALPSCGISDNWSCMFARPQLPLLFFPDGNFTPADYTGMPQLAGDTRALLTNYSQNSAGTFDPLNNNGYFTNSNLWAVQKWMNLGGSEYVPTDTQWPDVDIPLLRLSEAYLNYAEAVLRGGKTYGDLTALEAFNTIRRRAGASQMINLSLDNILSERGREFYGEGIRRTDLVRFGKFGGNTGYQWAFKSGKTDGADFPAYMNLFPIPQKFIISGDLKQNEGY